MPNRTLLCQLVLEGRTIALTLPGVDMGAIRHRHSIIEALPGVEHVINRQEIGYVNVDELPGEDNDTLFIRANNRGRVQQITAEMLHLFEVWFAEELAVDTSAYPESLDLIKSSIGGKAPDPGA